MSDTESQLVDALFRARATAALVPPPSESGVELTLEAGYRVGHALHGRLIADGFRPVGRKIGFTNPALWERFRVAQPIWAPVYAQTVHHARSDVVRLSLNGMAAPRLEPEIVLKLRRPVPTDHPPVEELAACVEWAAVGFEVVDSHYPDWRFTAAEAVADFGVHAALVVGEPWEFASESPREVAAALESLGVTLHQDQTAFADGHGRNALGSPLLALGFLATVLASQPWAPPLGPGELVTTGTLTPVPPVRRGERWRASVTGAPLAPLELLLDH